MEKLHNSQRQVILIQRAQFVLEYVFDKQETVSIHQERTIRSFLAHFAKKIDQLELAKIVMENRSSDYDSSSAIVDRAKSFVELMDKLNLYEIYMENLKELVEILRKLMKKEVPSTEQLTKSHNTLAKMKEYIKEEEPDG